MKHFARLCRAINYTFTDNALFKQALTHCSAGSNNNERLEFLGDSILNMVIAEAIYHKFPLESEGKLSRLRASLVKGDTLAEIAVEIDLGDYLYLGQGELKSGGFRRSSILADALEAIFAAILLDKDINAAKEVILFLYESRLNAEDLLDKLKDPKTQLQEYLQSTQSPLPNYTVTKIIENQQGQIFHTTCSIPDSNISGYGEGSNRRKAEQKAAREALAKLKK